MRLILGFFLLLVGLGAEARVVLIQCGDKDPVKALNILLYTEPQLGSDAYGQVSNGPYRALNLICNNGEVLKDLHSDITCAGVDRPTSKSVRPQTVVEVIEFISGAYRWRGLDCW